MQVSEEKIQAFVTAINTWGAVHTRSFPWRETTNPYNVLIAELMLHRTKAEQVLPVYNSFIAKNPDVEVLVKTPLSTINNEIKSLGLAYRGTRLKQIGAILDECHEGRVPSDYKSLLKLPGVGQYISNAVLCFAFGQQRPILDTNVIRVIHRFFAIPVPSEAHKNKELWAFMEHIISKTEARAFNLAILDLAALICKARHPEHNKCPLNQYCNYFLRNT